MKTQIPTPEQTLKLVLQLLNAPLAQITSTVRIQLVAAQGRLQRLIESDCSK